MARNEHRDLVLGIDIGTTSVKATIIEKSTKHIVQTQCRPTSAEHGSDVDVQANEQCSQRICTALQHAVSMLKKDHLIHVKTIGVCGQMHGVVLWKSGEAWTRNNFGRCCTDKTSQLFTWQDGRCSRAFLETLPTPDSHLRLSTGHGCATLFWLQRHRPEFLEKFDRAGTIHDFIVAMLCELDKPVMSTHNAASWGYYNTVTSEWNKEILSKHGFPVRLLPAVYRPDSVAGKLSEEWYGILQGTVVKVALGDLQCSVMPALRDDHDAVLNMSTSAQLSFIMPMGFSPPPRATLSPIEYFPYFQGRYLAVAASLNGGNVLAAFVRMLQQWTHELGLGVPENKIWEKILMLAAETELNGNDVTVVPTIYGERHAPEGKMSVCNITSQNVTLGKVSRALCHSLISNLRSMMSQEVLRRSDVRRIVGSGTALLKNRVLQEEFESQYGLPLVFDEQGSTDAAMGAAMAAIL
ncbi:PREDICTED: sedoheptulokinase-like [Priapulus caudatus]|uniref:Sedoheptulokinase-like n=1 Tax=Priapulus caudatus TaxID=37621 RepID=A0ABM1DQU0_PRICU|nr:PREDICTED: sedoheptulokinase-like [Priapulus caudatus]